MTGAEPAAEPQDDGPDAPGRGADGPARSGAVVDGFRVALESSGLIVHLVPVAEGSESYSSPTYQEVFGPHEPRWSFDAMWPNVHPDDQERVREIFLTGMAAALSGDRAAIDEVTARPFDNRVIDRHGQVRVFRWFGIPVYDGDAVHQICLLGRDVTEGADLEVASGLARSNLRTAIATTQDSTAELVHDVLNLVNPVSTYAHLLSRADLPPPAAEWVEQLTRAAQALTTALRSAIDVQFADHDCDPRPIVDEAVAWLRPMADRHGVTIGLSVAPQVPRALAPAARVQQIVLNLVSNAIKYGGGRVDLHLGTDDDGDVVLVVTDDGPGIPDEFVERIFRAGERIVDDDAPRVDGTGLGLWITERNVVSLGGRLTLERAEPHGARFEVRLSAAFDPPQ